MAEEPTSKSPRWMIVVALAVFAGVAMFLMSEVVLRVAGVTYPRTSQRDPNRGTARIPSIEWWQNEEGEAHITINRAGFRDSERAVGKLAHVYRIAVLGDSMVEALQVPAEQRFTEVLEEILNTRQCYGP